MKLVLSSNIPTRWLQLPGTRILHECDIRLTAASRLRVKVLFFRKPEDLVRFWWKRMGHELEADCPGVANDLQTIRCKIDKKGVKSNERIETDARYFSVIGLSLPITTEIVLHEAVHAAYAYERRVKRMPWEPYKSFDEERICYPAGKIADAILRFANQKKLI